MFSRFAAARKSLILIWLTLAGLVLAACDTGGTSNTGPRIDASRPVPVALLVPAGSANRNDVILAQSLENAARMAVADLDGVKIDLRVYPTGGQAAGAANAAQQAVNDGAKIILGPVYAEAANAAGRMAAPAGVNVLAFSNNSAIAGGNVFVMGQTFEDTARRLTRYASSKGFKKVHIVHGNDGSEITGRDAISSAISRSGAQLAGVTSFALSQQGLVNAVPKIVSEVRASGADAVFLTSGNSGALPLLAQLLPESGLGPSSAKFLGLQRWDIPASALTLPGLQGGWFVRPDPGPIAQFSNRYSAAYGGQPHPIASLAYDGVAAVGALARRGKSDALTRSALTQSAGFAGVGGTFRFLSDGTSQRGLAIATINNNQVQIVDPAPKSFGGGGS